jgi:hypothetical protein
MNKVSTPTPLLDYTIKFNRLSDINKDTKQHDIKVDDREKKDKLLKLQQVRRFEQDRLFQKHIEEIHRYESIKLTREYEEYRYQYYLGSKVDKYI